MVRTQKLKTITNRENLWVDSNGCSICPFANCNRCCKVGYCTRVQTFVMNGTELFASVFVVGIVSDMLSP